MFKKVTSGLLIILLAFSFAGCSKTSDKKETKEETKAETKAVTKEVAKEETKEETKDQIISLGKNEGNVYSNDFFNMTVTMPDKWVVATDEEKMEVLEVGKEVIAGEDKSKAEEIDLSAAKSVYLLMISEKGLKDKSASNSNFIVVAEKISLSQGVKDGADYLEAVKGQLKSVASTMPYNLDKEIYTEKVDGKDFSVLEATIKVGDVKMTQKYYASVLNGYALSFVNTITSDESAKILDKVIKSITFK